MKRLKLKYNGKYILSDIFNMKAVRVMHDILDSGEITRELIDTAATSGVIAMFDGTEITEDIIVGWRGLDASELSLARYKVKEWFDGFLSRSRDENMVGTPPPKPVLSFYKSLLDRHLPSEIDKQDPQLLFDVMAADKGDSISANEIPDDMKIYYGL